jgi:1-deoxy-D-xylulose-5-phosphate reductoisomerase
LLASVLGCTGSIGINTIEVLEHLSIPVASLAAGKNSVMMEQLARRCRPRIAALFDENAAADLRVRLADTDIKVLGGEDGVLEAASVETDVCINAIVGIAGLRPTLTALSGSRRVALANKESLVCAGSIITKYAKRLEREIIPVDSEHSAIFQVLQSSHRRRDLNKILLTASGGPFFGMTSDDLKNVTLNDALRHPNWDMGKKISVDSATLMNKGLEFIEAMRLFEVEPDQIEVIIHRESIIHSMVEFVDGSIIAQLGVADMKIPIQYAITFPDREPSNAKSLDLFEIGRLSFNQPDIDTFPCLGLAIKAAQDGEGACVRLNAANEAAVELFLEQKIKFVDIPKLTEYVTNNLNVPGEPSLLEIFEIDAESRRMVYDKAANMR